MPYEEFLAQVGSTNLELAAQRLNVPIAVAQIAVARDAVRYEPTERFTTWLFTIARNRMLDSNRISRRQVSLEAVGYEAESVLAQLTTEPSVGPLAAAMLA